MMSPAQAMDLPAPHALPAEGVLAALAVDAERGLDEADVAARRALYGRNEIETRRRRSALNILAHQFASAVVALLAVAGLLSLAFGDVHEALAILAVLLLNTMIGFITELKAERSMEALRALGSHAQLVRRNGSPVHVPAEELVPGDIVLIEEGDIVTADARLVSAANVSVDESALTGESVPVDKSPAPVVENAGIGDRSSMLFKGTAVTRGAAVAAVTATGQRSELGRIAKLASEAAPEPSPLEKQLATLSTQMIVATLAIAAIIAIGGIVQGKNPLVMVEAAIALAVAAIPEGLPVVATLVLARGMWRMASNNALIERLSAVETLGATTVIFTDKTGTITENRMAVRLLRTASHELTLSATGFEEEGRPVPSDRLPEDVMALLTIAALCNRGRIGEDGEPVAGDPMELALLRAAAGAGLTRTHLIEQHPEIAHHAFDSGLRMMATVHQAHDGLVTAAKGAPEALLAKATHCAVDGSIVPLDDELRQEWSEHIADMAGAGLRVLAFARHQSETRAPAADPYRNLVLLGMMGLYDPPRSDVRDAVAACQDAGIRVIMVTGDHGVTAQSIARTIGLGNHAPRVVEGSELDADGGLEPARLLETDVFARVSPAQKLALVGIYQAAGEVVAMTGDGVNDAPALRKADIGVAMGQRGTEIAREAAAMVLRDDAFSTIVAAVREGRVIFANIRRFVVYLLGCNLSEVMIVGLAILAGLPLPLLPLQILFLNLVTDVFPAFALAMGEGADDTMRRPPRDPKQPIVGQSDWISVAGHGLAITAATLGAVEISRHWLSTSDGMAITAAFLTLALAQLWHVFNMADRKSRGRLDSSVVRSPYIWAALATCVALLLIALYAPPLRYVLRLELPDASLWGLVVGMSFVPLCLAAIGRRLSAIPRAWQGAGQGQRGA
ncbi:MAG: cation-transporting P-type ATPase [Hyphomicrobiaceae bacterium]|nr:MAG: cation-transporting P-type ATPase [Hyphomicrobiaceae bacterium]